MENFKNLIISSTPNQTAEEIKKADRGIIKKVLSSNDIDLIGRIISTENEKANNIIFNSIDTKSLTEALIIAPSDCTWKFLQNINHNQLSKISRNLSIYPDDTITELLKYAPTIKQIINITREFSPEKRVFFMDLFEHIEYITERHIAADKNRNFEIFGMGKIQKNKDDELLTKYLSDLKTKTKSAEKDLAQIQMQLAETMQRHAITEQSIKKREEDLDKKITELEEERKKQVQQRIEVKVPEYVIAAVEALEKRESDYRKKAKNWAIYGSIVLLVAISSTILISLYGTGIFNEQKFTELNWQSLVFISFKGLIILGVLGLWAKHAFAVSNAYMHEAIKRSDRAHAINFGKLYLEIYGNSVERKELIDIFENWNITSESAFAKVSSEFEPKIIEKLSEIVKSIQPNSSKQNQS